MGNAWKYTKLKREKLYYTHTQDGTLKALLLEYPDRFGVYRKRKLTLSKGDEIRVTKPCFDVNGKHLNNGSILTITGMSKKDGITAVKKSKSKSTAFQLSVDFGNWKYAYCSTSHSAQGKTVDHVLINQLSVTFPATNQKQFCVSVSRGREGVTIYTDDAEELLEHIEKQGDRQGATELKKVNFDKSIKVEKELNRHVEPPKTIDIDYEPEL